MKKVMKKKKRQIKRHRMTRKQKQDLCEELEQSGFEC